MACFACLLLFTTTEWKERKEGLITKILNFKFALLSSRLKTRTNLSLVVDSVDQIIDFVVGLERGRERENKRRNQSKSATKVKWTPESSKRISSFHVVTFTFHSNFCSLFLLSHSQFKKPFQVVKLLSSGTKFNEKEKGTHFNLRPFSRKRYSYH